MNVIVFASRKGGSGKSTVAAHLAAYAHKPVAALSPHRHRSARIAHALAQTAQRRRAAAASRATRRRRHRQGGQTRRHRVGLYRYAAQHVGERHRRDPRRHAGRRSMPAGRVRSRGGQGDRRFRAAAAQALCGRHQRRAAAAAGRRVADGRRTPERRSPSCTSRCGAARSPSGRHSRSLWRKARAPRNTTPIPTPPPKSGGCGRRSRNPCKAIHGARERAAMHRVAA